MITEPQAIAGRTLRAEHIHPALWRASQLARPHGRHIDTGFNDLSAQLPGQGWPLGCLVEILAPQPGAGEMQLLRPALILSAKQRIALIQPPYTPQIAAWANWGGQASQLLWIRPKHATDSLWATEQILRSDTFGAALLWQSTVRSQALRRLHLAAQQSNTLLVMLRSPAEARQPCAAPLRLGLRPAAQGLLVSILKRRGPACEHAIPIILHPERAYSSSGAHHVSLDQPSSAPPQPGRRFSSLAH